MATPQTPPAAPGIPPLRAVLVVWLMLGALLVATFVTYSWVAVDDLYHVSRSGLAGGASRALVATNFPVAIAAAVMLPVVTARLLAGVRAPRTRWLVAALGIVAAMLCAVTALPGVVDQADLDAKAINLVPAAGVVIVLGLTFFAARVRRPVVSGGGSRAGGWARGVMVGAVVIIGLPWLFADLGLFVDDVPGLGALYLSDEFASPGDRLPAVHLGHHHGMDGVVFAVSALLLMPAAVSMGRGWLRHVATAAVALMFVYGLALVAEDSWGEQVVKRGWSDWDFPQVIRPELTVMWGLIVLGTVALYGFLVLTGPRQSRDDPARRTHTVTTAHVTVKERPR